MITRYRFSLLVIVGGHGIFKKWIFFSHKLIWKFHFFNIKFWGLLCTIWKWQFSKTLIYLDLSKIFWLFLISLLLGKKFHFNFKNNTLPWPVKIFLTFQTFNSLLFLIKFFTSISKTLVFLDIWKFFDFLDYFFFIFIALPVC